MSTAPPPSRNGYAEPAPHEAGGPERDFDVRYYTDLLWRRRILLAATAIGGPPDSPAPCEGVGEGAGATLPGGAGSRERCARGGGGLSVG